jgi:hypothetical protein
MRAVRIIAVMVAAGALAGCTASAPVATLVAAPGGMPRYYVTMAGASAMVRDSATGRVTGSVRVPVSVLRGRDDTYLTVYGAADDRHFVIEVSNGGDLPGVSEATLYTLSVSAVGWPGTPHELNFSSDGVPVTGVALSPDGTRLALSLMYDGPLLASAPYGDLEVINVATGTFRVWSGRGAPHYWPGVPSWTGDDTVSVPWWHSASRSTTPAAVTGVRVLDTSAPGASLLASRLVSFPPPG